MKPHQLRALCLAASALVALACYWGSTSPTSSEWRPLK